MGQHMDVGVTDKELQRMSQGCFDFLKLIWSYTLFKTIA